MFFCAILIYDTLQILIYVQYVTKSLRSRTASLITPFSDTHTSPLANEGGANEGLGRLTLRDERAERRRRRNRKSSERSTGGRGERKRKGRSQKEEEEEGYLSLENIFGSSYMSGTTQVNALQPPQCNSREPTPDPVAERFVELGCLGDGGYGTVYAGYRREDNLPVRSI